MNRDNFELFVAMERQLVKDRYASRLRAFQTIQWGIEDDLHDRLAILRAAQYR